MESKSKLKNSFNGKLKESNNEEIEIDTLKSN